MHSSSMRTARGSSRPRGGGLPQCMLGYTPRCGPGDTPPGLGLETPQVWARRPPWRPARHAGIPPARHAGIPPPSRPAARHAGIPPAMHAGITPPPVNRMTDRCKNITLPQTSFAGGNNVIDQKQLNRKEPHCTSITDIISLIGSTLCK